MSYVLPTTGNKITISSPADTIASGSVTISLIVKNAASFSGSAYDMDVTNIGSIEVDFNYIEEIGDINDFKVNLPRIELEMLDSIKLSSGSTRESLIDLISSLTGDDVIIIKVDLNSASDYYYATRDNCEFSFTKRSVKMSGVHPIKFGLLPLDSTWGNTYFSGKYVLLDNLYFDANLDPIYVDTVLPRDLIEGYLSQLGTNVNVQYQSTIYPYSYNDLPSDNTATLMPSDYAAGNYASQTFDSAPTDFEVATERVKQYALSECAIIGNVLGYAFYVPRFDKSANNESVLTSDDFESLDLDIKFKNVRFYDFLSEHTNTDNVTTNTGTAPEVINSLGDVDITVYYPKPTYQESADYDQGVDRFVRAGSIYNYPAGFADDLEIAFKKIFRISDSLSSIDAGSYISGTILGIDKLKPYEYFSVGSGVHPLVDNKDFRPAYLKYNLLDDTIEFEAYEF